MRRRTRAILPRLALTLAGLLVGTAAAEGLARVIRPRGGADLLMGVQITPPGMFQADPDLMYVPVPGFQAAGTSLAGSVDVRVNSLGLRGPEPAPDPDPRRWLVLGDSFALALQVPEERTFEGLLDEALGPDVEVWNGGVDGYSTWQSTLRYDAVDDRLRSRAVLLLYFLGNDLYDDTWFPIAIRQWSVRNFHPPPPQVGFKGWLERNSFLFAQFQVRRNRSAVASDPARLSRWTQELELFTRGGKDKLQFSIDFTTRALIELLNLTMQRDDALVVAVAPPAFQVDTARAAGTLQMVGLDPAEADLEAPRRAVLTALRQLGIRTCDLVDPLKEAAAAGKSTYFTFDGHWNSVGHAVVAEALEPCLREAAPW